MKVTSLYIFIGLYSFYKSLQDSFLSLKKRKNINLIMDKKEISKLFNEAWHASYIQNKNNVRIFSFPDFRRNLEMENLTEKHLQEIANTLKPALLESMSAEELIQWVYNPNKSQLEVEDFLMFSFDGSFSSSKESQFSESDIFPPLSN